MHSGFRLLFLPVIVSALLSSCGEPPPPMTRNDIGPGIGPFDSAGNYREDWADDPSKWRRPATVARNDQPPANANPMPSGSSYNSKRPAPTTAAVQRATPPKPSVRRHTVKRGDSLSAIARRYNSSVSAIRSANRISGSLIYPGQRLVIPSR